MFIFIYIHTHASTRIYASTLGAYARRPTRGRALFPRSLACEKLFSAFKRRRVRAEKCWNVGITRAYVRVGVHSARAHARIRLHLTYL